MILLQAWQQRQMDQMAMDLGISGILLMEHAALALAKHIEQAACAKAQIAIVCGPGNNGGDGFALARLLHQQNYQVTIICAEKETHMSKDEAYYAHIAENLEIDWYKGQDLVHVESILAAADMIVDALFGTGLTRAIDGYYSALIQLINQQDAYVLAVDIASGIEADSGCMLGCAVKADATVTFAAGKIGQYMQEGLLHSGAVEICDIAIPQKIMKQMKPYAHILNHAYVQQMMPKRFHNAHKGSYGKALLIGGSSAMSGAVSMAAQAALLSGVGTLSVMAPKDACAIIATRQNEVMRIPMPQADGWFAPVDMQDMLTQYDVAAIGNGMGRGAGAESIVMQTLQSNLPCIVDGDGLYHLSRHMELLHRKATTILTPHPREISYLLGISTSDVLKNPSEALKTLEKAYPGTIVVMKGTKTFISDGNTRFLNIAGNNGLATGGSGDVLCGIVLGLLAQHQDALSAAAAAVYLHAYSADLLLEKMTTYSILPTSILEILPTAIQNIMNYEV